MRTIKSLAWWLCLLLVCVLSVLAIAHSQLHDIVGTHQGRVFYLLLALLLGIPASIVTIAAVYLFELLLIGWPRSSLKLLWEARASVKLDVLSISMTLLPLRPQPWYCCNRS